MGGFKARGPVQLRGGEEGGPLSLFPRSSLWNQAPRPGPTKSTAGYPKLLFTQNSGKSGPAPGVFHKNRSGPPPPPHIHTSSAGPKSRWMDMSFPTPHVGANVRGAPTSLNSRQTLELRTPRGLGWGRAEKGPPCAMSMLSKQRRGHTPAFGNATCVSVSKTGLSRHVVHALAAPNATPSKGEGPLHPLPF